MSHFILNNEEIHTQLPPGMLLLDFIRYQQNLKGTKIGCREGDCGACTVLVGHLQPDGQVKYQNVTSCLMPLGNAHGKHIVSIEGLNMAELSPVQQAIAAEDASQCGFCTIGFVNSLTGFCLSTQNATYKDAIASIDGNICRCTGYKSLERAANRIAIALTDKPAHNSLEWLVNNKFIPTYFKDIPQRLQTLQQTIQQEEKSENTNKYVVGGGTDLYVQKPEDVVKSTVQLLYKEDTRKSIEVKEGFCYVGASATVTEFQNAEVIQEIFPDINRYMKLVSSTPIRNMASLGGNIVNASPIGDMTAFFLALDASLTLTKNSSHRTVSLKDFFKGYKIIDLQEGETVENIFFQIPAKNAFFNFEKVSKRTHLDIASVNSAMSLELENDIIKKIHLSVGGVSATPLYLKEYVNYMTGKTINPDTIKAGFEYIYKGISPISDIRGSADYKKLLTRQLVLAHFLTFFPNLKPEEII